MAEFYYFGTNPKPHKDMLAEYFSPPPRAVSVDIETISLKDRVPIGLSIATSPNDSFYFPMLPSVSPVLPWHILKDPSITKVYHNAPFDLSCLDLMKYDVDKTNIGDTAVIARLLGYPPPLVNFAAYVDMEVRNAGDVMEELGAKTMLDIPEDIVAKKCCEDTSATIALYLKFIGRMSATDLDNYSVDMAIIPVLLEMSSKGMLIDHEVRDRLEKKLDASVEHYRSLAEGIGFNPASPYQVGFILAKRGNFLPFTRSKRQIKTDVEVLKKCQDPVASLTLLFRKDNYFLTHYVKPWKDSTRAYTHFHLDAVTSRVSSTDRNMNNVPKGEARNMFLPDSGVFTDWDYSQLQLRILAYMSQDKRMLYVFETGGNIHEDSAKELNTEYTLAKSTNFAMVFGGTDETLAETAEVPIERARMLRQHWFSIYKEAADWIISQQNESLRTLKTYSMYNRLMLLPPEEKDSELRRKAINYPIQGSEAEIAKRAMLKCTHLDLRLMLYDEFLVDGDIEVPDGMDTVCPMLHTPYSVKKLSRWE